jgi:predicted acylesterase/phospholipase RssA
MLNVAKIWEVARATSAATTFFEPITIDDETFVDGATGANNPIQYMWAEAGDVWGIQNRHLEDEVRCLVSIGTGMPSLQAFGLGLLDIAKSLKAIATDTEEEAELFQKHHTKLFQTKRAFRFNVLHGLEHIGLEEVEKWGEMKAATRKYIQTEGAHVQVKACALSLQEQECMSFASAVGLNIHANFHLQGLRPCVVSF